MGTVLSLSPRSRKAAGGVCVDEKPDLATGGKPQEKSLKKRHSVLLHALTWKRLVAASAKKKNAKKVNPKPDPSQAKPDPSQAKPDPSQAKSDPLVDQLNTDNIKKSQPSNGILDRKPTGPKPGPIPVPVPTVPDQTRRQNQNGRLFISPRRVVVQASTGELLRCLSDFLCRRCFKLKELTANEVILWFRNVDRALLVQGWQDQGFITPANLVFVYLLCREAVEEDTVSEYELQATFLTCLYLAYSYMGNEISYPLKPFLVESSREAFWERALGLIDRMSGPMLRINADPHYFTEVFQDLKNEGGSREKEKEKKEKEKKEKDGKRISELDR